MWHQTPYPTYRRFGCVSGGLRGPFILSVMASKIVIPLVVLVVCAAVYVPTLSYAFVSDDSRQISMASTRYAWSYIPSYFTTDIWSFVEQSKSNYYRPVFLIWLLLNYS